MSTSERKKTQKGNENEQWDIDTPIPTEVKKKANQIPRSRSVTHKSRSSRKHRGEIRDKDVKAFTKWSKSQPVETLHESRSEQKGGGFRIVERGDSKIEKMRRLSIQVSSQLSAGEIVMLRVRGNVVHGGYARYFGYHKMVVLRKNRWYIENGLKAVGERLVFLQFEDVRDVLENMRTDYNVKHHDSKQNRSKTIKSSSKVDYSDSGRRKSEHSLNEATQSTITELLTSLDVMYITPAHESLIRTFPVGTPMVQAKELYLRLMLDCATHKDRPVANFAACLSELIDDETVGNTVKIIQRRIARLYRDPPMVTSTNPPTKEKQKNSKKSSKSNKFQNPHTKIVVRRARQLQLTDTTVPGCTAWDLDCHYKDKIVEFKTKSEEYAAKYNEVQKSLTRAEKRIARLTQQRQRHNRKYEEKSDSLKWDLTTANEKIDSLKHEISGLNSMVQHYAQERNKLIEDSFKAKELLAETKIQSQTTIFKIKEELRMSDMEFERVEREKNELTQQLNAIKQELEQNSKKGWFSSKSETKRK